jgi:hypothetical protein
MRVFYETNKTNYFSPPGTVLFNWIVIQANESRSLEQAKDMTEMLYLKAKSQVESATDFVGRRKVIQDFAAEYSDHPSGDYNKGFMFYYTKGDHWDSLHGELQTEIVRCPVKELSRVVQVDDSSFGFFIVKEKTDSYVQPYDSDTVKKLLPNMIMEEEWKKWRQNLYDRYNLEIYDDKLNAPFPIP